LGGLGLDVDEIKAKILGPLPGVELALSYQLKTPVFSSSFLLLLLLFVFL
jgi:hypothetical protein